MQEIFLEKFFDIFNYVEYLLTSSYIFDMYTAIQRAFDIYEIYMHSIVFLATNYTMTQ